MCPSPARTFLSCLPGRGPLIRAGRPRSRHRVNATSSGSAHSPGEARRWQAVITTVPADTAALPPSPDRSEKKCGHGSGADVQLTRPAVTPYPQAWPFAPPFRPSATPSLTTYTLPEPDVAEPGTEVRTSPVSGSTPASA